MSYFNVTILGCGSATPSLRHNPSAQAVCYHQKCMLIDCGEGTQLQLRRFGISFAKITDIFISHLHGDHFLGLPGLLSTMALHSVEGTVTIHTFAEGADILRRLMDIFCRERTFRIVYDIIDPKNPGVVYEDDNLTVTAFPLFHRVPCVGYIFREKPKRRHIDGEAAKFYAIPPYAMNSLRDGNDFVAPDGTVIPNSRLTKDPSPSMSYAYASDTVFNPDVAEAVSGVDVLFHEATYGDDGEFKAAPRGHSTARQAARIAQMAGVGRLVIGHYSKVITDSEALADEAREEFPHVTAANEGLKIDLI